MAYYAEFTGEGAGSCLAFTPKLYHANNIPSGGMPTRYAARPRRPGTLHYSVLPRACRMIRAVDTPMMISAAIMSTQTRTHTF